MIKIKRSLFVFVILFLSPLIYANDKGFLEYKQEEGQAPVVVKQEINAELEMRLRRLEETNKRLTDRLARLLDSKDLPFPKELLDPDAEVIVDNAEIEKPQTLTLQEKADFESFNYSEFTVVAEAATYFILKDSQNRRKIVKKSEIEEFNKKITPKIPNKAQEEEKSDSISTKFEGK